MKKLLLALALLISVMGTAQTTFTGTVVKIKDGDTIVVLDSTKTMHTIRLAGIDAPEKKQNFGQTAKQFTSDQIYKLTVTIKVVSKDRYGRSVAWVFYNKNNLSEELLRVGLAWHYIQYDKSNYLQSLEDFAKKNKVGLWVQSNPVPPSEYRKSKNKQ